MSNFLPITHSIVNSNSLSKIIESNWDFPNPVHCELLNRGMNDVYLIRDSKNNYYACRVWRSGFRSEDDIKFETELLSFLDRNNINVPYPIESSNNSLYMTIKAPEGIRFFSIFKWVDGLLFGSKPDVNNAFKLGVQLAKIHQALKGFIPSVSREIDMKMKFDIEKSFLFKMNTHRTDDLKWYRTATTVMINKLVELNSKSIPSGVVHGDFHLYNAFFKNDIINVMDFDNCGNFYLMFDICSFIWANDYVGIDKEISKSFLKGYKTIRSLNDEESSLFNFFYALKELSFLCGFAANVNSVGHTPLLSPNLDWFYKKTRSNFQKAGLV
ncbi:MAG: Homoserine kinase [Alphaproteobacteria bacterium MarineAlpha2_Bin1]|nr:MAG: Homoserine kinase [Alphaproteobacteria bacterium MarineAlpha2_Bin1]